VLLLNPRVVKFGGASWEGVAAVVIDRSAARLAEEWGDSGPYATFADVPEQRVRVRVVQELSGDDVGSPRPGDEGTLEFFTSPARSDGGRRRVSIACVVLGVEHEVSLKKGALRTVTLAAVSSDGAADPVVVSDASDGQV
jgi:hypothetical protein